MKVSQVLLCVTVTLSLAGVVLVSCRRIHPPTPASRPAASQPATQATATSAPAPKFIWYTIKRGDTARRIASRLLEHGQDGDIVKNNPEITNWNRLSVGMQVRLPIRKLKDKSLLPVDLSDPLYAADPPPPPPRPEEELKHPY